MYLVKNLYEEFKESLEIVLVCSEKGLSREIKKAEIQRPGLRLAGFTKNYNKQRILVFGTLEIEYLKELNSSVKTKRLKTIISSSTPAVIITHNDIPPKEILSICKDNQIPLFRTPKPTVVFLSQLFFILHEKFSPLEITHGTLVEVFGMGILLKGESSVGKSETALGLLERGHRLISDDIVKIKRRARDLIGSGPELTRHIMEIRGVGIINVAYLYGALSVRPDSKIDLIVKLEPWNEKKFYDRLGEEEKSINVLGVSISFHLLPMKPGRDMVLLIETLALNQRLKVLGYHSAKEFKSKLQRTINRKVLSENNNKSKSKKQIRTACKTCGYDSKGLAE